MTRPVKDVAASVRQRLMNSAKTSGRPFQEVLEYFAMERFLHRLARSSHSHQFVLKGALLFRAWGGSTTRPTRDIDLLGHAENTVDAMVPIFRTVCEVVVEPDGMVYNSATVTATVISEDANYSGVRVSLLATLQNARVAMQIDIGFADVITPGSVPIEYPVILDLPAPRLFGYPRETVVAEKFEAMVKLQILNSRMKDFYDLFIIASRYDFEGTMLALAISKTFVNRKTKVTTNPVALTSAFASAPGKMSQWKGFLRKSKLTDAPIDLNAVLMELRGFLLPIAQALVERADFHLSWRAPGPWR